MGSSSPFSSATSRDSVNIRATNRIFINLDTVATHRVAASSGDVVGFVYWWASVTRQLEPTTYDCGVTAVVSTHLESVAATLCWGTAIISTILEPLSSRFAVTAVRQPLSARFEWLDAVAASARVEWFDAVAAYACRACRTNERSEWPFVIELYAVGPHFDEHLECDAYGATPARKHTAFWWSRAVWPSRISVAWLSVMAIVVELSLIMRRGVRRRLASISIMKGVMVRQSVISCKW